MKVHGRCHFSARLFAGAMLGLAAVLCPTAPFAAEGPALPPAEYKPLPEGTKVRYADWQFEVKRSEGAKVVIRTNVNQWFSFYAVFGRDGTNVYKGYSKGGTTSQSGWDVTLDDEARAAFEGLWPLKVGKTAEARIQDHHGMGEVVVPWTITLEVVRTDYLELDGRNYPVYVVKETRTHPEFAVPRIAWGNQGAATRIEFIHWYSPDAGVILKTESEVLAGFGKQTQPGDIDQYSLVSITYPEGTTTHALKDVAPASAAARSVSDAAKDSAAWEEIKYSNRVSDFQRYLEQFPAGMFVQLAESQMRDLIRRQADPDTVKSQFASIQFGDYHALVIGIADYKYLPKLKTALNDAKAVAKVLEKQYGFKVTLLIDPSRLDIIDAFDEYRETLGPKDNLLIYYAGHGWLDEEVDRGYWLPVDAQRKRRGRWMSNATITDTLKGLDAKHVMVVADSCYSGTLVRAADVGVRTRTGDYWKQMAEKWARVAITSGGLEPVADKGGGGHSPFAKAFIDVLRGNDAVIDGTELFSKMRRPVMVAADQTPQYADVRQAGHDGGDFLFVRKK